MKELCNCGRPIRYSHLDGKSSCNKYNVCPTYDELYNILNIHKSQNNIMKSVLCKIVKFDKQAYTYRAWADEALTDINKQGNT